PRDRLAVDEELEVLEPLVRDELDRVALVGPYEVVYCKAHEHLLVILINSNLDSRNPHPVSDDSCDHDLPHPILFRRVPHRRRVRPPISRGSGNARDFITRSLERGCDRPACGHSSHDPEASLTSRGTRHARGPIIRMAPHARRFLDNPSESGPPT